MDAIDKNFKTYRSISQTIPFMMLGLDMIQETYKNLQIYEDIIKIYQDNTQPMPLVTLHFDREKTDKLSETVLKFKTNRAKKYLVIYLGIYFPSFTGHSTVLLLQKKKNKVTMERFDPDYLVGDDQNMVDDYMHNLSLFLGVEYIPASSACPYIGPQRLGDRTSGYCQTYVLHYIRDRLVYAFANQVRVVSNTITKALNKVLVEELEDIIKSIVAYIFAKYKMTSDTREMLLNYDNLDYNGKEAVVTYLVSLRK